MGFQKQCRGCRRKHLGLSALLVTIEILQNQSGLHATVFLSIDPSRFFFAGLPAADDRFTFVMTLISLSELSSFCRPFFTSLGLSRIGRIFVSRIRFHTCLVTEECVHRYESLTSVGISTSSFFASVFAGKHSSTLLS